MGRAARASFSGLYRHACFSQSNTKKAVVTAQNTRVSSLGTVWQRNEAAEGQNPLLGSSPRWNFILAAGTGLRLGEFCADVDTIQHAGFDCVKIKMSAGRNNSPVNSQHALSLTCLSRDIATTYTGLLPAAYLLSGSLFSEGILLEMQV